MSLTLTYTRYQLVETLRVPIAVVSTVFFPTASMIFFVIPFAGDIPLAATMSTGSMVTFATMITCLFQYGAGVAEDRAAPWDPYLRTLPAGAVPRFAGRIIVGLIFVLVAVVPVVVVAALFTSATITPVQFVVGLGALIVVTVPFTLMGLAIGYSLPAKAALAVTTIIFMPLAFGGGLMTDPTAMPGFLQTVSPYLPTRGAAELVWAAISDFSPDPTSMIMLVVWTAAMAALAWWAYRRDEGRRFA